MLVNMNYYSRRNKEYVCIFVAVSNDMGLV